MILFLLLKLASAAISVALGAGILARDHGLKANRLIAAFLFCNAWWATCEFFLNQQVDPEGAALFYRLLTLGWMPMGVLYMHASLTLSSIEHQRVGRMLAPCYGAVVLMLPLAMTSEWVISGAERGTFGWHATFGVGMLPAYFFLATPVLVTLSCWRSAMAMPSSGGQRQLARIVFFGLSGALFAGTLTAIVIPLFGMTAIGITTTLIALVGLAAAWTLRQHGHSLISSQAFAREILDTLEDGVIVVGEDFMLRDANRAFLRMIGVGESSAIGRPITTWISDFAERDGELTCSMDLTPAAGLERSVRMKPSAEMRPSTFMEVRTRAGEIVPVVVSASDEFSRSSHFSGQAFLLRDRREILALQRRIVGSARLAAVGDLAKSISRSIHEPVARTKSELEGLSVDWQTAEEIVELATLEKPCREAIAEGQELIDECVEGVDRILSIVREIGGFSSESSNAAFVEASLSEIVTRAIRIAKVSAPTWLKLDANLDAEVKIDCHPEEIERVVTNLLINSIQALQETRSTVGHLVVGVAAFEERAVIHVEDDGGGIDSEVLDRIFDPFFTTKPVGQGTGLGLAISYHIVKGHGGDIRVSSLPGRGTSVTVELPFISGRR